MRYFLLFLYLLVGSATAYAQVQPELPNSTTSETLSTIEAYFAAREAADAARMLALVDNAARWKAKSAFETFEGGHDNIADDLKVIGFDLPPRIGFTVLNNAGEIVTLQVNYTGPVGGAQFTVTRMETFIVVGGRIESLDAEYIDMRATN